MSDLHALISSGTAEGLRAAAALLDGCSDAEQAQAIAATSPHDVTMMLTDLYTSNEVVTTARRGYQIPADPLAEAVQALLAGREAAWVSRYRAAASTTPPVYFDDLLALLQSQRIERHQRAAWMLTHLLPHLTAETAPIEALFLNHSPCVDLSFLSGLPHLKILILDHTSIADLSPLRATPELQHLSLRGASATRFEVLSELTALQRLVLDGAEHFTTPQVLAPLRGLRELDLRQSPIAAAGSLPPLPQLTTLRIGMPDQAVDLSGLQHLSTLQSLHISAAQVEGLESLSDLPSLRSLYITGAALPQLAPITALQGLTALGLMDCTVAALPIDSLPALTELNLLGTAVELKGALPPALSILAVDDFSMIAAQLPDAAQRADNENLSEPESLPSLSLVQGSRLKK